MSRKSRESEMRVQIQVLRARVEELEFDRDALIKKVLRLEKSAGQDNYLERMKTWQL